MTHTVASCDRPKARPDSAAHPKLAELYTLLAKEAAPSAGSAPALNGVAIAEFLFSRAPAEYLERMTVDRLLDIARKSVRLCAEFLSADAASPGAAAPKRGKSGAAEKTSAAATDRFRVHAENVPRPEGRRLTTLYSVGFDRPFIVDTLIETLRTHGLEHRLLLHPIAPVRALVEAGGATASGRTADRHLSIVYIETKRSADESRVAALQEALAHNFDDLVLITDHFDEMLGRLEDTTARLSRTNGVAGHEDESQEHAAYLRWLGDGGFVFLGCREWSYMSGDGQPADAPPALQQLNRDLGIFCSTTPTMVEGLRDVEENARFLARSAESIHFSKILTESPVHRRAKIDVVGVSFPRPDAPGERIVRMFVGLFTSKARSQEASSVPLIRRKLRTILEQEGLLPNSHDYKEIVSIVDSIPKSELVQNRLDVLRRDINLIINIQRRAELRLRTHLDDLGRFISVVVVVPRERFSEDVRYQIQRAVEHACRAPEGSAESSVMVTEYPLAVLHLVVPRETGVTGDLPVAELERTLDELSMTWDEKLQHAVAAETEDDTLARELLSYSRILPPQYKASTSTRDALRDIRGLERLSPSNTLEATLTETASTPTDTTYLLTLYKKGDDFTLSAILPYIENVGFDIVSEDVTSVELRSKAQAAIYRLRVRPKRGRPIDLERACRTVIPALKLVLTGEAENDRLNELLLDPGLEYREIAVLRALSHYLLQIKGAPSDQAIVTALIENPAVAAVLVQLFDTKFNPSSGPASAIEREPQLTEVRERFHTSLKAVVQLAHDRLLRALANIIAATVRTNFYRPESDTRVALKIRCAALERAPEPRPLFEIFVNAPDFEGTHLRGGRVARGGIRWSDRTDDYRTEVLGLMKTQMLKNSIIIPVGAKGGFVLKQRPTAQKELLEAVRAKYIRFIRSLLEVTDNILDGAVVHPPHVMVYDGEDPYFVVAADRGTATFSDTANSLSQEFNLWLGDAFASGGSNGYDHKKLGITARGAWEAVCRHFREIGIDVDNQDFTVVGIGDMSGDVFGNGLLLSRRARLLGAFNHKHIFIDPDPDALRSFSERERLFALPGSQWSDYDPQAISPGGGVFERTEKEIAVTPEMARALDISVTTISGEELIKAILRAPADLLWNGGIGTYVKASTEENYNVGDRTNDDVRIDAKELRVKVVGEGGNLGLTQLARIEYSKIGGHLNTDAVDNSGGVNTSDLEVNLKILLKGPVDRGEITLEQRNELLTSVANDVCEKVIGKNREQSLTLSLGVRRSRKHLETYRGFIEYLERAKLLDRKGEFLPDDDALARRVQLKAGLTRPELAILMGYAKMTLFNLLLESSILDEKYVERYLFGYFPKPFVQRFPEDIRNHRLRREIIATELSNIIVERMGVPFAYRIGEETGSEIESIVRAFIVSDAVLSGGELAATLRALDRPSSSRLHHTLLLRVTSAIDGMTRWFLEHRPESQSVGENVERYQQIFRELTRRVDELTTGVEKNRYREASRQLIMGGLPKELASSLAAVTYAVAFLDISELSLLLSVSPIEVAQLYSNLAVSLHIRQLFEMAAHIEPGNKWEASALRTLTSDLRRSIAKLCRAVIAARGVASTEEMQEYLNERREILNRFALTYQEFQSSPLTIPALLAITNQLYSLSRGAV